MDDDARKGMRDQALFDKIDLHLIRVLHTVLTERSVSRAACGWACTSRRCRRRSSACANWRATRLLVRSGAGMVPTDAGAAHGRAQRKHPACRRGAVLAMRAASIRRPPTTTFRVAAADYLDPHLPAAAGGAGEGAGAALPRSRSIRCRPPPTTTPSWRRARSTWWSATGCSRRTTCTWASCSRDEVVCLVAARPPGGAPRLDAGELAGRRAHRAHAHPPRRARRDRRIPGRPGPGAQHHGALRRTSALIPAHGGVELAGADHRPPVLRALHRPAAGADPALPGRLSRRSMYYQLWHERTHASAAGRWLRERVKAVAAA